MSPTLTPQQARRQLFRRISAIGAGYTGPDGVIRIHLTQENRDDLEEGEKDLAERRAKSAELSPVELDEFETNAETMQQTLAAIELWGS